SGISDTGGVIEHLNDNASSENGYSLDDVRELLESIPSDRPYMGTGRLIEEVFPDGRRKVYIYDGDTDVITETRVYDLAGNLVEKKVRTPGDESFITLGSLPWIRYGEGIGTRSWDEWHSGYSRGRSGDEWLTGEEELRANLLKWSGSTVRIFLFGDLRCGLKFEDGVFMGFTDHVLEDMQTLLDVAAELDISLIPVIFDYRMADGESGYYEREYPELITNELLTDVLLDHFGWFFREVSQMRNYDRIMAWDVMNEPELCGEGYCGDSTGVTMEDVSRFVRKFAAKIHDTDNAAKVTVGSLTKEFMAKYWMIPDMALENGDLSTIDIYQFHYYDSSSEWHDNDMEDLNYPKTLLAGYAQANDPFRYVFAPGRFSGREVFGGEIDPTRVEGKMDTLYNYGYDGLIFWDDKGNMLGLEEYDAVRNWFPGVRYTYYADTGREKSATWPAAAGDGYVYRYYSNEAYQYIGTADERGRVLAEVMARTDDLGVLGYTYEYQVDGSVNVIAYHAVDLTGTDVPIFSDQVYSEERDASGQPVEGTRVFSAVYYPDSWYKMADLEDGTTKYYLNENWESRGYGREIFEIRTEGVYVYSSVDGQYERFGEWVWDSVDLSDPLNPRFEGFRGYNGGWNDSTTEYYNSDAPENEKKMRSRYLPGGDVHGIEFYLYVDQEIGPSGTPEVELARLLEANAKNERTYVYEYHEGTRMVSRVSSYSVWGEDPSEMIQENRIAVYDYDILGRISSVSFSEANVIGEMSFEYEYYEGTDTLKLVTSYSDEEMTEEVFFYSYDDNGNSLGYCEFFEEESTLIKRVYDNKERVIKEERADISLWGTGEVYGQERGFFSFDGDRGTYVDCGKDDSLNMGNTLTLYALARVGEGGGYLISKVDGDQGQYGMAIAPDTGSLLFIYGDARSRKQLDLNFFSEDWRDGEWHEFAITVTPASPPSSVWVTGYVDGKAYRQRNTYYSDISWPRRSGKNKDYSINEKSDVSVFLGARGDGDSGTAFVLDGDIAEAGIYGRALSSLEIMTMSEGEHLTEGLVSFWDLGAQGSREIDDLPGSNAGRLFSSSAAPDTFQTAEYTYYDLPYDNRRESMTLEYPDEDGNIYYHYMNTETNSMDVSQLAEANENGEIAFEYEYYDGTDIVKYVLAYYDVERQDLYGTYEYDMEGTLIGFTPASGPASIVPRGEMVFSDTVVEADHLRSFFDRVAEKTAKIPVRDVVVAVLDSGLDVTRFAANIIGGYDLSGSDRGASFGNDDISDHLGHGTSTAKVIAEVAPEADILVMKVLDDENKTKSEILSKAIMYSVEMGARILAMPLTLGSVTDELKAAISYALDRGALLFAAAGNNGSEIKDNSLASQEGVISVGSVDNDGKLSVWSNFGDELDLLLPWDISSYYDTTGEAGTSFSTAYAAGIAALLISENPQMTSGEVFSGIKNLAEDIGKEAARIKGVNVDELLSKQEAILRSREEFTGYQITDTTRDLDTKMPKN
ncbi:MAG: S8 family serine peptidase, partial [Candidatus Omnitrophica bacterium]|nr:S8 family serine peptidase [Candidatus Omnitrophota bacterium]